MTNQPNPSDVSGFVSEAGLQGVLSPGLTSALSLFQSLPAQEQLAGLILFCGLWLRTTDSGAYRGSLAWSSALREVATIFTHCSNVAVSEATLSEVSGSEDMDSLV